MKLNKRIIGLTGINAIMSAWNNGMDNIPLTDNDGNIIAHDTTLKYHIRKQLCNQGDNVWTRIVRNDKNEILDDAKKYEKIFNVKPTKKDMCENLFKCMDNKNFGVVFTQTGNSFNAQGVVQFNMGRNVCDETNIRKEQINAPKPGKTKVDSTLGEFYITDEAMYVYDMLIDPNSLDEIVELYGEKYSYTEEDYNNIKKALLCSVTNTCNSRSKKGCYNEFSMFIEMKDLESGYNDDLNRYVKAYRDENNKMVIDLSGIEEHLNVIKDRIDKIEIYYNPVKTKMIFDDSKFNNVIRKNILIPDMEIK